MRSASSLDGTVTKTLIAHQVGLPPLKASCHSLGMGIRTSLPRKTPYRDFGRTLPVLLALSLGACKSGPAKVIEPAQKKVDPPKALAKAPKAAPTNPPTPAPAKVETPKPEAKKAPRAGDAPSRASHIGKLAFVERTFDPAQSKDPKTLPVLVMIHGLGDRPDNFIHLADQLKQAHRALSLQGLSPYKGSFGNGYAWFQTRVKAGKDKKLAKEINLAAAAVAKGLKALNTKEGQPQRRFIVTGFSQGGILSYALAVQYPELIATAVPVAGLLPPLSRRPKGSKRGKIIAFHGQADKIVPFARGRELGDWLSAQGFDYDLKSFPEIGHRIPQPMAAPLHQTLDQLLAAPLAPTKKAL